MKRWIIKDLSLDICIAEKFETKLDAMNYLAVSYAKYDIYFNADNFKIVERSFHHFEVHHTNFGYSYPIEFETLYDAIKYGESKGFEFNIIRHNFDNTTDIIATGSPIGGLAFIEKR